jgi:IS1 family transposase
MLLSARSRNCGEGRPKRTLWCREKCVLNVDQGGTKETATSIRGSKTIAVNSVAGPFILQPDNTVITEEQHRLIERLLLERISLRGICRAVGVGLQWLLQFMVERFQAAPEHLYAEPQGSPLTVIVQRLEAELDELWSLVGKKANRHWVWNAMDATTRQVIAFPVGDRSGQSAQALWKKIPAGYQEHAVFYTDHYAVYTGVIPFAQHRAISKAGPQNQSRRTVQLHATTTGLAAGACHVVILEEAQQSHRRHQVFHL